MAVTKPAVIVATAVAGSPAKARPIESDINTATVISHPGTFITGKLPAFLGYRIPFGDCNEAESENHEGMHDCTCRAVGLKFKMCGPRGHAAGIRTLPTPTPLVTVRPQKKDSLLGAGRRAEMDLNHHPQEHHRPDSLSYPSLLASSGLGV